MRNQPHQEDRTDNLPDLLARAGTLLYGALWQEALARDLGISGRSVRYWVAGERPVPDGVWGKIAEIAAKRRVDLAALVRELRDHAPPSP